LEHWLSLKNLGAASAALLFLIYSTIVLSTASVKYVETVHRVTVQKIFEESFLGSISTDCLAALGLSLLCVNLIIRPAPTRVAISIAIFVAGIIFYLTASYDVLKIIGAASVPSFVAFLISIHIGKRKSKEAGQTLFSLRASLFSTQVQVTAKRVIGAILISIILLETVAASRWAAALFLPVTDIYSGTDPFSHIARLESALFHSLGILSPILVMFLAFSFVFKWYIPEIANRVSTYLFKQNYRQNIGKYGMPNENSQIKSTSIVLADEKKNTVEQGHAPHLIRKHNSSYNKGIDPITYSAITTTAIEKNGLCKNKASLRIGRISSRAIVASALIVSVLITVFPHLPPINPKGVGVSTDEQFYINWMNKLRSQSALNHEDTRGRDDLFSIIESAFAINKGDRPFTLLIILALANLTALPDIAIIRYLPVVLAPLLVLATYLFIKYIPAGTSKEKVGPLEQLYRYHNIAIDPRFCASIAALFTAFSLQIIVGEYAGFLANWFAIILAYLIFYYVIKSWQSSNFQKTIIYSILIFALLILIMLFHVYTWEYLLAFTFFFSALSYIFGRKSVTHSKVKILILLIIICSTLSIDYYSKSQFINNYQTPISSDSAVARNIENAQGQESIWNRLYFTLGTYVGGFLSNPVLYLLALVWVIGANPKRDLDRVLLSMLFMIAIPILIGSVEFQTRLLYNMPFQIPAALIVASSITMPISTNTFRIRWWQVDNRILLLIAVIAVMACFAIRAMSNLYLVTPDGYTLGNQFLLP
jgi:hypothetical protein